MILIITLRLRIKSVNIREELGVRSIQEKVREMGLRWYGHMQRVEENNEVRAVGDMRVPGKSQGETKREMEGLQPKGNTGTADHPGGCPGQYILEINNSGR